jgi:hypothetical protein
MDAAKLIQKLLEIEREYDFHGSPEVHSRMIEAQNIAVELYHDRIAILNENVRLRDALQVAMALNPRSIESGFRSLTGD